MGTSDPPKKKAAALRQPTETSPAGAESSRGFAEGRSQEAKSFWNLEFGRSAPTSFNSQ